MMCGCNCVGESGCVGVAALIDSTTVCGWVWVIVWECVGVVV